MQPTCFQITYLPISLFFKTSAPSHWWRGWKGSHVYTLWHFSWTQLIGPELDTWSKLCQSIGWPGTNQIQASKFEPLEAETIHSWWLLSWQKNLVLTSQHQVNGSLLWVNRKRRKPGLQLGDHSWALNPPGTGEREKGSCFVSYQFSGSQSLWGWGVLPILRF